MKIALFTDWHLHKWMSFGVDENGLSKRLNDQIQVSEKIKNFLLEQKIKRLIFGGDLYHKVGEVPVECMNVAHDFFRFLRENNIEYDLVGGNHDFINRKFPQWYHYASRPFELVNLGEEEAQIKLINYIDEVNYDEIVGFDIVVAHKQPNLVNEYGIKFDGVDWERLAENNRYVFFGHYHERTILSGNCFIMGSVMPLTFADTNDRGMWVVETNDWSVNFHAIPSPRFITVETPDQVKHDDGNYYRVLHADKRVEDNNVVTVIEPKYFDERLKSTDFNGILNEWVAINEKDKSYIEAVESTITTKIQTTGDVFNGRLVSIDITDFLSIGEIQYKIENGFILVNGRNDIFDSNGSGKTSMFEAIYWCLFGETTKGLTGDDVVRRGFKDCKVTVELQDTEKKIFVTRSRKGGISILVDDGGTVAPNIVEGYKLSDAQNILESILGFDKNVFLASCYFSQESLSMFTHLGDADRTNMITRLLGFEKYDDLYVSFKTASSETFKTIDEKHAEIDKDEVEIRVEENNINNMENTMGELNNDILNYENHINRLKRELGQLNEKMHELNESKDVKVDWVDIDEKILQLTKQEETMIKQSEQLYVEINAISPKISDKHNEITQLVTEARGHNSRIDEYRREIDNLSNSNFGERCDKCGSTITQDNIQVFIDEKLKKIEELSATITNFRGKANTCEIEMKDLEEKKKKLISEREQYDTNFIRQEIKTLNTQKDDAVKKSKEIEIERTRVQTSITDKSEHLFDYETNLKECNDKFVKLNSMVDKTNKLIERYKDRILKTNERIDELKNKLEICEFWKNAFSPTGIRSLLIDRFCNEFNRIANEYLSTASNGLMSVTMTPTKTLKSGAERNKLGFEIIIGSDTVKYESLSGGEKRRLDSAVCLAINKWISLRMGVRHGLFGMMVLDELFNNIDRLGEEAIATLLNDEGKHKAVFVISHTPELASYADRIITVVKENGVSSLEHTFAYQ
jgi:DNA repair ATPase RecN